MNAKGNYQTIRTVTIPWGPGTTVPREQLADEVRAHRILKEACQEDASVWLQNQDKTILGMTDDLDPSPDRVLRASEEEGRQHLLEVKGSIVAGVRKATSFHLLSTDSGSPKEISIQWLPDGNVQSYQKVESDESQQVRTSLELNANRTLTYTTEQWVASESRLLKNIQNGVTTRRSITVPLDSEIPKEHRDEMAQMRSLSNEFKQTCVRDLRESADPKETRQGWTKDLDPSPERAVRFRKMLGHNYMVEAEGKEREGVMKPAYFRLVCLDGPRSEHSFRWGDKGELLSYHSGSVEQDTLCEATYQDNGNGTLTHTWMETNLKESAVKLRDFEA